MISVDEALAKVLDLATPMPIEEVPLIQATGRVLARDIAARRTQPPFNAAAMDGYAILDEDARLGARLQVIGSSAAGHGFDGPCHPGQAVRIFTGAPVPEGATRVEIQENTQVEGDEIILTDLSTGTHIRPKGDDFAAGDLIQAPRSLRPADIALAAAMNHATLPVATRPEVAILATGDELVPPGDTPGPDQIIAANSYGIAAALQSWGARARILPIAGDRVEDLRMGFDLAQGADVIVTIGGASVGDHDLVAPVAQDLGLERAFYKIAMRPGKPLMAGRLGRAAMIGLPGNPISAMVCARVFLRPLIRAMQGLTNQETPRRLRLAGAIPANGPRQHYMRAACRGDTVEVFARQDSALLSVFAEANALVIRPPHDGARKAGEWVDVLDLDQNA